MIVAGTSFGPYRVLVHLGQGASGQVWRARHDASGSLVALKILTTRDPELALRFKREGDALARVAGAGMVPVHASGVERGAPWIALGLCPGGTLRGRLLEGRRWSAHEATALALPLCRALGRCHSAGLVHRDVKPENILFDGEDRPVLADLGMSRDLRDARLTATGALVGTLAYMAPEQLAGEAADARADVYALGAVLYELLTGASPYASAADHVHAQLAARIVGPPELPRTIDDELRAVVRSAMSLEPEHRPRDGAELETLLAATLAPRPRRGHARRAFLALAAVSGASIVIALAAAPEPGATRRDDPGLLARLTAQEAIVAPARLGLPVAPLGADIVRSLTSEVERAGSREARTLLALAIAEDALARGEPASIETALSGLTDPRAELVRCVALGEEAIPRLEALRRGALALEAELALARRALLRGVAPAEPPRTVAGAGEVISSACRLVRAGRLDHDALGRLGELRRRDPRLAAACGGTLLARAARLATSPARAATILATLELDDPEAIQAPPAALAARQCLDALLAALERGSDDLRLELENAVAATIAHGLCARSDERLLPSLRIQRALLTLQVRLPPEPATTAMLLMAHARLGEDSPKLERDLEAVVRIVEREGRSGPARLVRAQIELWRPLDEAVREALLPELEAIGADARVNRRMRAYALFLAAQMAFSVADFPRAEVALRRCLGEGCAMPDRAWQLLGVGLALAGRLEEARAAAEAAETSSRARSSQGELGPAEGASLAREWDVTFRSPSARLPVLRGQILTALEDEAGLERLIASLEGDARRRTSRGALAAMRAILAGRDQGPLEGVEPDDRLGDALTEAADMARAAGRLEVAARIDRYVQRLPPGQR